MLAAECARQGGCCAETPPDALLDESACENSGISRLEAAVEDRWHALPSFVRDKWGNAITQMIALAREDEREVAAAALRQLTEERDSLRTEVARLTPKEG
jgi:hypothetical protein